MLLLFMVSVFTGLTASGCFDIDECLYRFGKTPKTRAFKATQVLCVQHYLPSTPDCLCVGWAVDARYCLCLQCMQAALQYILAAQQSLCHRGLAGSNSCTIRVHVHSCLHCQIMRCHRLHHSLHLMLILSLLFRAISGAS